MHVLAHQYDRTVTASERLNLDARKGQEARLMGTLRLKGLQKPITFTTPRIDGVAILIATVSM